MSRKNAAKHSMLAVLQTKYGQGHGSSKRNAKAAHEGVSPFIHSETTYQTYRQQVARFGDWLTEHHPGTNYYTAPAYVQEYIDQLRAEGKSAWTQQLARSAIGKALDREPTSLASCDTRHADSIQRGRSTTAHAAAAAEKWSADLKICECVGVRHHKESPQVTPEHCRWADGHIVSVALIGKGGRPREAVVLPGEGRDLLEERCRMASAPNAPLLGALTGANVHGARAVYAARCYALALAEGHTSGRLYSPRNLPGQSFDTGALDFVNQQLGHGAGRYDVAVYNYLSYGTGSR